MPSDNLTVTDDDDKGCWKSTQPSGFDPCKERQQAMRLQALPAWQARQLYGRDLLISSFLLLALLCHLALTTPELCSARQGPAPAGKHSSLHGSSMRDFVSAQAADTPLAVQLVCGSHLSDFQTRSWNGFASAVEGFAPSKTPAAAAMYPAAPVAAAVIGRFPWWLLHAAYGLTRRLMSVGRSACSLLLSVLLYMCRAFWVFFGCGFMTGDPFYIVIPPLRLCMWALLLLPLPYSGWTVAQLTSRVHSPSITHYTPHMLWQQTGLRAAVVILQRLVPIVTAFTSVGCTSSPLLHLTALSTRSLVVQYVFLGWTAWMYAVPIRLHLIVNFIEWLLTFFTVIRVRMSHLDEPLGCSSHLVQLLLILLLVLVLVLPTVGVAAVERNQWVKYQHQLLMQARSSRSDTAAGVTIECDSGKHREQQQQQQCSGTYLCPMDLSGSVQENTCAVKSDKSAEADTCQQVKHSRLKQQSIRRQQEAQGWQQADVVDSAMLAAVTTPTVAVADAHNADDMCKSNGRADDDIYCCSNKAMTDGAVGDVVSYSSRCSVDSSQCTAGSQFLADINSSLLLAAARVPGQTIIGNNSSNYTTCSQAPSYQYDHHQQQQRRQQLQCDESMATVSEYIPYFYSRTARTADARLRHTADSTQIDPLSDVLKPACPLSSFASVMPRLAPTIRSLIGDQQAAAVFAAAASAAAGSSGLKSGSPTAVVRYRSMAPQQVCHCYEALHLEVNRSVVGC